ncbi:integrin alpha FG-GAP repeat-containing protein 2 [Mortierella sp. AD094]|nr:integrin alpha FG-GAP repeat-containing protein 2 [Mortierella sp. AD094]
MPTARHVSLVQKLRWHVSGNISPTAFAIGDVEGHGDNAFVIGNLVGDLFIFKGNHPEGLPWLTCKGLGTITAVTIGDIRNWGKNSIVVMSAEGLCHIFDIAGLDDDNGHLPTVGLNMPSAPTGAGGSRHGHPHSIYSSTPQQGSYHASSSINNVNSLHPSIPATPSIKPVPDIHSHHHSSSIQHGTPPQPQNTPHGSEASSITGFNHAQANTPNNTPIHSHAGSIYSGIGGGARRGSDAVFTQTSAAKTTAVLANLIGTPPTLSSSSHGPMAGMVGPTHRPRSIGVNSAANSPQGTPLLKPQHHSSKRNNTGISSNGAAVRNSISGRTQVRNVGGRRILERPNLTLPVPVNINRAYIGDIDGDGLNEIVLARTDRIMHSYSLQTSKVNSPPNSAHPNGQHPNLAKFISRTSSISTLDSSGLLSPSDDRREIAMHYPSLSSVGKQFYSGGVTSVAATITGTTAGLDARETGNANDSAARLTLVERKRWALDGQIHCLAATKDPNTKLPILLVAQPGLKFIMVDHEGNMSEPVTQIQRNPLTSVNTVGPDIPTRVAGSGDVATDILCGTHYINGEKKDIIGLMSMDGAFALHDLESNTVKVHDLDSTHKIFGFSKLNFGTDYHDRRDSNRKSCSEYADESNYDGGEGYEGEDDEDDADADVSDDDRTAAVGQTLDGYNVDDNSRHKRRVKARRARRRHAPSMLISDSFGSRFPRNDMFVGCSWSGITFFIDQEFNTAQYDFDARVCAFGAGQYAIAPGKNEPCLFYVDFEDNIYVYYNLYIQTEPSVEFQDIFKADPTLVRASQQADKDRLSHQKVDDAESSTSVPDTIESSKTDEGVSNPNIPNNKHSATTTSDWSESKVKEFIHDSLYNVNRYEDEFQRLKRLANIEIAKRTAFLEAEAQKERDRQEAERRTTEAEALAAITAETEVSAGAQGSPNFMGPLLRRPQLTVNNLELSRGKGVQRGQFPGLEISTNVGSIPSKYTQMKQNANSDDNHSPSSPLSPASMSGKTYLERRRSSLQVKDVLSHYEGKITPPLKSPVSPSTHSNQTSKDYRSGLSHTSSGSSATLTNFMKRLSNAGLSRSSSVSSGSSGSSGSSQNTITYGHPLLGAPVLTKGKALETKVGKALRTNRPIGVPRNRPLGVAGRKMGARSRLSLQQDHEDDTEEGEDDQAPSEDGTAETDGDNLIEFDRASRKSTGEDDFQSGRDYEQDLVSDDFFRSAQGNEVNEGEEDVIGVYTPSTISPIPSPGRIYTNQLGSASETSASLDGSAFMLAKSLLSPSSRSIASGGIVATGKTSRRLEPDNSHGSAPSSSSRSHTRRRSGHGLLDAGLGYLPTREIASSIGIGSGPNSAGHNSVQDGRRSRAESLLSTGSDIGGIIVPDITLVSSSFTAQSSIPFSASEPISRGNIPAEDSGEDIDDEAIHPGKDRQKSARKQAIESQERSTAAVGSEGRRPPPPRRSATLGSQDGAGSGSDTAPAKPSAQRIKQSGAERRGSVSNVKLMPAPLPRSNQHHQRQQQSDQPGLSGRPNNGSGGGGNGDGAHGGGEGYGWGHGGKSTSTTSSANVSEFGSGPSSPLAPNITVGHAILSHPSSNSYKGFSVLSLPVTSPSPSVASAYQHQYFSTLPPQAPVSHSGSSLHNFIGGTHPLDSVSVHEDDRVSIRSRNSTFPGDDNDISSVLAAAVATSMTGGSGGGEHHGALGMSLGSTSSSNLVSDSLVRRLEELQQQDRDQEEKKRQKDREEKEKEKHKVAVQPARPAPLSRANSGASVQSTASHRVHSVSSSSQAPTSHGSGTTGGGSGPASGSGRYTWEDDQHESSRRIRNRPGFGQGL